VAGFAGPNPQNVTDPNINVHFDWYEFNNQNGIFINTTQVDQFGLPSRSMSGFRRNLHQQVGITESVAQIDSEFASEVPAQFQPPTMSNLRILSPAKLSMAPGGANANYFDSYIASAWASYNHTPLAVTLNGRQFTGTNIGIDLHVYRGQPCCGQCRRGLCRAAAFDTGCTGMRRHHGLWSSG